LTTASRTSRASYAIQLCVIGRERAARLPRRLQSLADLRYTVLLDDDVTLDLHATRQSEWRITRSDTADPVEHQLLFLLGLQRMRSATLNLEATERTLCLSVAARRPIVTATPRRLEDGFSCSDPDTSAKWLDFDHTPLDFRTSLFSRYEFSSISEIQFGPTVDDYTLIGWSWFPVAGLHARIGGTERPGQSCRR